jgi:hypothetical protein
MAELGTSANVSKQDITSLAKGDFGFYDKNTLHFNNQIEFFKDTLAKFTTDVRNTINIGNLEPETVTTYFVMRGRDTECVSVTYYTWVVTGAPDTDGSEYSGPKCGTDPLEDIVVLFKYTQ